MEEELKRKILDLRGFTVPQIQHDFNVSYGTARQCVEELLRDDLIRPVNKMRYAVRQRKSRVITKVELLQNYYSDFDRVEMALRDESIIRLMNNKTNVKCKELGNFLRSCVPQNLPLTAAVQTALYIAKSFNSNNIKTLLRGIQFGKDKCRCVYYFTCRQKETIVRAVLQRCVRENPQKFSIKYAYKYAELGVAVADILYFTQLPSVGKRVASMLTANKVSKNQIGAFGRERGISLADMWQSVHNLADLGILNVLPAAHGSRAYKFSVDAKYFESLLPKYLWGY